MKIDRGTLIRSIALGLALLNQALVNFGLESVPGTTEAWYQIMSTVATVGIAIWTWFKNNYITFRGQQQRQVLIQNGLTSDK